MAQSMRDGGLFLHDRVALVSGSGSNTGRAIARELAEYGASVAVHDFEIDRAEAVRDEIITQGGQAMALTGALIDELEVDVLFQRIERELGVVDLVVNNAWHRGAPSVWGPFLTIEHGAWRDFLDVNLAILHLVTRRAAGELARRGIPGTIVNMSSHGALRAHRNHIPWDALKGATDSFTRSVAVDLAPWHIRVNGIRPGAVKADTDRYSPEQHELRDRQIPLGRAGEPGDICGAVIFLSSSLSEWMTGQTFNVDGGMAAQARAPQVELVPVWTPATLTGFGA